MQFINPQFWWLGLLALVPVVLFLFRRKSRTVQVSTLVFFKALAREHQESAWLRRLKRLLSLLLTLLLLIGAVSALVRIVFSPVSSDTRNIVILVDRSASMAAESGGRDRLDLARSLIRNRLDGVSKAVGISLIAYDARPEIIQPRTLERRALLSALDGIQVRPVSADEDAAIEAARTLARLETPAEVWHVSDHDVDFSRLPLDVKAVQLGVGLEDAVNVGFTAFQIRKLPLQSSRFTAFLRIMCNESAPGPVEGQIEVRLGGVFLSPRQFELQPGESRSYEIPVDGAEGQLLHLNLDVAGDCLDLDNSIVVPLPSSRPIVVARYTGDTGQADPYTHFALQSLVKEGELNIWSANPDNWPISDVDVVILENWMPEVWDPTVPTIVINPPEGRGPVQVVPLAGGIPHQQIRVANQDHPVLFRVSSSRVDVTQTCVFDSTGSLEPLWFAGTEPVLAAGTAAGQRLVVMGFEPRSSSRLPLTASFPLLIGNAIFWCAEGQEPTEDRVLASKTGDVLEIGGSQLSWTTASGDRLTTGTQPVERSLVELERSGYWESDEGMRGTAHLLSTMETNIGSAETAVVDGDSPDLDRKILLGDITWLILAGVLVLLLAESALFHWFRVF